MNLIACVLGIDHKIRTYLTLLGIIFSFSLMTPFMKLEVSTAEVAALELRYVAYVSIVSFLDSWTSVFNSGSLAVSNKKL